MKVIKLLIACIASISILGFLGNDSIVLEAKLFRCTIAGATAIYFFRLFILDQISSSNTSEADLVEEAEPVEESKPDIFPSELKSESKIEVEKSAQRCVLVMQITDCIKQICEQAALPEKETPYITANNQIKDIEKLFSAEADTPERNTPKLKRPLDYDFNEYYKSAFIAVPAIEEGNDHYVFDDDSRKPPSRLAYEKLWREAPPIEIYKDAYISRKATTLPSSYIVFDTETTGLEYQIEKIIEIGAIKYIDHTPVEKFQMLINPERELDEFITKLTHIKNEDLTDKLTIDKVLPMFFDFIEGYILIAHNAPFDIKMLACEAYRSEIELFNNKVIDTLTLARRCIPKVKVKDYKLSTLKDYFGLANNSHRALEDCEVCSAIYQYYCSCINSA